MKIPPFPSLPTVSTKKFVLAPRKQTVVFTLANWTSFKPTRANDFDNDNCSSASRKAKAKHTAYCSPLCPHRRARVAGGASRSWKDWDVTQSVSPQSINSLIDIPGAPVFPRRQKASSQSTESLIKCSTRWHSQKTSVRFFVAVKRTAIIPRVF